jgi:hypothetical protein
MRSIYIGRLVCSLYLRIQHDATPHSHTTQATNATIANANRQEAKTKQKRTKKRDQLDFESVEIQLADCKAKIAMLEISNNAFSMMPVSTIFAFYGRLSVYCGFTILAV